MATLLLVPLAPLLLLLGAGVDLVEEVEVGGGPGARGAGEREVPGAGVEGGERGLDDGGVLVVDEEGDEEDGDEEARERERGAGPARGRLLAPAAASKKSGKLKLAPFPRGDRRLLLPLPLARRAGMDGWTDASGRWRSAGISSPRPVVGDAGRSGQRRRPAAPSCTVRYGAERAEDRCVVELGEDEWGAVGLT